MVVIKAVAKIVLSGTLILVLLAVAITIVMHFANEKRVGKEYWGGYGLPTEFHDH